MTWWQSRHIGFLDDVVGKLNYSMEKSEPIDRTDCAFKAMNRMWNEFVAYTREQPGGMFGWRLRDGEPTDDESFSQLVVASMPLAREWRRCQALVESPELRRLVSLDPRLMDCNVIRRRCSDPSVIPPQVREEAEQKHTRLARNVGAYRPGDTRAMKDVLRSLVSFLWTVRCNIAHGWKAVGGIDKQGKDRDRTVCSASWPVLELLLDAVLDYPSTRLAVYGTLAPGAANASMLDGIGPQWSMVKVRGSLSTIDGLSVFRWEEGGEVDMDMCRSNSLRQRFPELDTFEGERYRRILVPVRQKDGSLTISNVYARPDDREGHRGENP